VTLTGLLLLLPFAQPPLVNRSWPALERAEWAAFRYQFLPDQPTGDYAVSGGVRAQGSDPHGRLALDVRDESSYYALDLAHDQIRLLRIESGLELPIGRCHSPGLAAGVWHELLVRREGAEIRAFLDGEEAASAADGTYSDGRIATGSISGSVGFRDLLVQDLARAYFEDDFMRNEEEKGGWETAGGRWHVQSIGSPVRSSNAFNLTSGRAPRGATALYGDWFSHDYEAAASCQPHGPGWIGLYAHYRDPRNHYLLLFGQPSPRAPGEAQLIGVKAGKREALESVPVPYQPGQWYRLGLRVEEGQVTGLIDGHEVLQASAHGLPGGKAGLYARGPDGATFDDFLVRQSPTLAVNVPDLGLWRALGGEWTVEASGAAPVLRAKSASSAKLLFGERLTSDAEIAATCTRPAGGEVGLVAGWQDEQTTYLLTCGGVPLTLRLLHIADGQATTLGEAPISSSTGALRLSLALRGGLLCGGVTGGPELLSWQGSFPKGQVGLFARDGEASFASLSVRRLAPLPEVAHFEGAFTQEVSMADWAAEGSDWTTLPAAAGDPGPTYWHRSPAYGDRKLSVHLTSPPSGPVALLLAASAPGAADGYRFTVTPGTPGSVALLRAGAQVAAETPPSLAAENLQRVALARTAPFVIGFLNERPVLTFRDPEPLPGLYSGWTAPAGVARPTDAVLYADDVRSYSFRSAPDEWWVGAGQWRITNRWDCEPRWTFFIGGGKGVAALWNKHELGPDITLDFYGAIRFDSTHGYEYGYAANINGTIAADGQDLTTGYSLVFGGWDDKYTRLLRGNQVVAESATVLIPRASSIHRQWFNLRLQKAGARIRCWIDGAPLFDYTDPNPLTGTRAAIWTYDNSIAVARVRIAASDIRPGPLDPPTRPPRCCYDEGTGATQPVPMAPS